MPEKLKATAKTVVAVQKYNGQMKILQLLRDALKGEFWAGLWEEMLTKGAATQEASPELEQLVTKLEDDHGDMDVLIEACKKLQSFKGLLRSGATSALESAILARARNTGEQIVQTNARGQTVSSIDAVVQALQLFNPPPPEIVALVAKLQKVKASQSKTLGLAELKGVLGGLPKDLTTGEMPDVPALNPQHLSQTLQTCADVDLDDEAILLLWQCVYWLLYQARRMILKDSLGSVLK